MSLTLNGSSVIRRFKGSDAIKIRDGITFNFYTELTHMDDHATYQVKGQRLFHPPPPHWFNMSRR